MEKRYLNKKDVSAITGLSVSTLNKWSMLRIHLPFIKAGGRILYDPEDVKKFMRKNRIKVSNG